MVWVINGGGDNMAYITVDGRNIYYEEYGAGLRPTLVYLHGGPGESCLTYSYQARKLGEHFHVISFDQYGVFRSDAIPEEERAGVKFHVDLIDRMRIALGIKSWIPIGHSFGGMLACWYAYKYPASTDAVIYDCPMWSALHTARAMADVLYPYYVGRGNEEMADVCREILLTPISPREAFDKVMYLEIDDGAREFCHIIKMDAYYDYLDDHIEEPELPREAREKYLTFARKLREEDDFYENYLVYLKKIKKAQLLIVGEYDMTCGKPEQEWFCEHLRNGKMVTFANSAHLSWFEHPKLYTDTIVGFVEGIRK